jgi:Domain of unknown function (DUF4349)
MWPFASAAPYGAIKRIHAAEAARGGRARPLVLAAAATAVVLAACGSAASAPDAGRFGPSSGGATAAPAPASGGSADGGGQASAAPGQQDTSPDVNLIIRMGSMTVEVPSIDPALLRARTAIAGLGGYISASDQSTDGDRIIASVTYRFPSAKWEDAQTAIREIATKVVSAKTGSSEVTGQVLDIGARIANLRATEQALQAIMAKATRIPDILEVQNQLTGVQGQIEQLSTQEAHLRDQASLATLTVLFQTPAVAVVQEVSKGWDFGAELDKAAAQLLSVGQVMATAGVWLVVVGLPVFGGTILFLLILLTVGRWLLRRMAPWLRRYEASTDVVGGPRA